MIDMSVDFCGIRFKNPISTASGTYGFGLEYAQVSPVSELGSITTKGLTIAPKRGNAGIRIMETPSGMLNSIGLENPGVRYFLTDILPKMKEVLLKDDCKIIANINGSTLEDYEKMAQSLHGLNEIALLEVNISCPNVKAGGMAFGTDWRMASEVCRRVKKYASQPVVVKLSPNVTDLIEIAKAVQDAGADGLSMINTVLGMSIDIKKCKPMLGNVTGGLSGPAVRPIGVRAVWQVSQAVDLPIIGMGGIFSVRDALEYILAGATMVSIGASNFSNPQLPFAIIDDLRHYCEDHGVTDFKQLIGKAWRGEPV